MNEIQKQNKASWNLIADDWIGTTALPIYGCLIPDETELGLFNEIKSGRVLDIGCGSGHSLLYHAKNGARELWGLDISEKQIKNATKLLNAEGLAPRLYCSAMEQNPGIPENYFDAVYSIYAIGWTTDLDKTFGIISSYLKKNGIFIFSWDHPFMHCISPAKGVYVLDGGYLDAKPFTFEKAGQSMTIVNHKFSTYINALFDAGFVVEKVVEQMKDDAQLNNKEFSSAYYSPSKAKLIPLSFVIKARKR